MLELDILISKISDFENKLSEMKESLKVDILLEELEKLEELINSEGFWEDIQRFQETNQKAKTIRTKIEKYEKLFNMYEEIKVIIELVQESEEFELIPEGESLGKDFLKLYEALKIETLFNGEYDNNSAIVMLTAGAGGTESCDWAQMLFRMYTRYCNKLGYEVEIYDIQDGDVAGIKSVSFEVKGENAYGHFKGEKGVHRLVRISPFDSSGKRHTSFAACDIMPVISDDIEIEIRDEDLKIDTYRASGAGGQHVNKTESAIRITHIPTGIVVTCQNERSQHKNKDSAMKVLKSYLVRLKEEENQKKLEDIRGEVKDNGWGSQIRSYVLQPYSMVKDHRTSCETGNTQSVMDGNIDEFVNSYLCWINS